MKRWQEMIATAVIVAVPLGVGDYFLWKLAERPVAQIVIPAPVVTIQAPSIVVQPAPVTVQTMPAPQVNVTVAPPPVVQPPPVPAPRPHKRRHKRCGCH